MTHDHSRHDHSHHDATSGSFWTSRAFLVFLGFAVIALIFLWSEHKAHILGTLPYVLLLACPLMHFFMHGGHGHGKSGHQDSRGAGKSDGGRP